MKILVTGATGYIGGSVAERLVVSGHTVVGLVRSREKALLLKQRGINPVVGTLDDWGVLTDAAHAADAVIHAASADHPGSVLTLVGALERSAKPLIYTTNRVSLRIPQMASMQAPLSSQRTPTSKLSRSGDPVCPAGGDPGFPRRRRVPAWTGVGYLQAGAGSRGSGKDGRVAVPSKRSGMG